MRDAYWFDVASVLVDEGILQITDFTTPSPLDFFLQRRRLNTASFDIWALLLPEVRTVFEMGGENSKYLLFEKDGSSGNLSIVDYQTNGDCNDWSYGARGDIDWTIETDGCRVRDVVQNILRHIEEYQSAFYPERHDKNASS